MSNRKGFIFSAATVTSLLLLTACSGGSEEAAADNTGQEYAGETLVVTSFGGDWETAFREAVVDPFEEETGAEVELVTLYSADALAQLTAQQASPQLDVVHFSGGQEYAAAEEGLIDAIAPEDLQTYDELAEIAVAGLDAGSGPAIQLAPIGLLFNTDSGVDAPSSWLDIFDEAYAGHVALTDFSNTYGLLSMLRVSDALGGGIADASPAITDLGELASSGDALVVPTSPDLQTAFAQRDTWVAPYAMDYAATLRDAGLPVEFIIPEEGATASLITSNMVSGRDNTELSKLFIDYELKASAQEIFAERMRYSPVNTSAELDEATSEEVLTGDELEELSLYPVKDIDTNRSEWTDQWNNLITQ